MIEFVRNSEAEAIAAEIIPEDHPHLTGCNIAYLSKVKSAKAASPKKKQRVKQHREGKKITMARTSMVSAKVRAAVGNKSPVFIIEFDDDIWQDLNEHARYALVDHELRHCGNDADGFYLRHHSLEEFRATVEKYGCWKSDVKQFAETAAEALHAEQNGATV